MTIAVLAPALSTAMKSAQRRFPYIRGCATSNAPTHTAATDWHTLPFQWSYKTELLPIEGTVFKDCPCWLPPSRDPSPRTSFTLVSNALAEALDQATIV